MSRQSEDKGVRRFNRAMIAAGAAVTAALVVSAYAVYRMQSVLQGMKENFDTTATLYNNPDDPYLNVGGNAGTSDAP